VLQALREGPHNILGLSRALDYPFLSSIPMKRLEAFGYLIRCGFTPTDLLHAEGSFLRWDAKAAKEALAGFSARLGVATEICSAMLRAAITEKLVAAILVEGVADSRGPRGDAEPAITGIGERFWAGAVSGKADGAFSYSMRLELPIIGVGAPIGAFLPDLAYRLGTRAVCPEHADTAGAVGAVISTVSEEVDLLIRPRSGGGYVLFGPDFKRDFGALETAKKTAMDLALSGIREKAAAGNVAEFIVEISLEDEAVALAEGQHYMESRIHAAARAMV
jgi:N-methylhydantoinase A/oxoprolinase/acetone carboxylase beta subunit